mmetsp:Transcript_43346/g.102806  ORF Transcript_43346/g.102806 Transcript_43346/m.102806 type:complete len:226 (-) Transcript_43346:220-897(-)
MNGLAPCLCGQLRLGRPTHGVHRRCCSCASNLRWLLRLGMRSRISVRPRSCSTDRPTSMRSSSGMPFSGWTSLALRIASFFTCWLACQWSAMRLFGSVSPPRAQGKMWSTWKPHTDQRFSARIETTLPKGSTRKSSFMLFGRSCLSAMVASRSFSSSHATLRTLSLLVSGLVRSLPLPRSFVPGITGYSASHRARSSAASPADITWPLYSKVPGSPSISLMRSYR